MTRKYPSGCRCRRGGGSSYLQSWSPAFGTVSGRELTPANLKSLFARLLQAENTSTLGVSRWKVLRKPVGPRPQICAQRTFGELLPS